MTMFRKLVYSVFAESRIQQKHCVYCVKLQLNNVFLLNLYPKYSMCQMSFKPFKCFVGGLITTFLPYGNLKLIKAKKLLLQKLKIKNIRYFKFCSVF